MTSQSPSFKKTASNLNLDSLPSEEVEYAIKAFIEGDGGGFADCGYSNHTMFDVVFTNARQLLQRGIYEQALVAALTGCKIDNRYFPVKFIVDFLNYGDRNKLRAVGEELPAGESFTVYRGVAGKRGHRRARGISWTFDQGIAAWFAARFFECDAAIYSAKVNAADIYCYFNGRNEQEVICFPKSYERLPLNAETIASMKRSPSKSEAQMAIAA